MLVEVEEELAKLQIECAEGKEVAQFIVTYATFLFRRASCSTFVWARVLLNFLPIGYQHHICQNACEESRILLPRDKKCGGGTRATKLLVARSPLAIKNAEVARARGETSVDESRALFLEIRKFNGARIRCRVL